MITEATPLEELQRSTAALGIMGTQLRAALKPRRASLQYDTEGFKVGHQLGQPCSYIKHVR